ncbi:MAG TPA: hypothetical protein VK179_12730 [Bacteroidales bacterium]|nr:hypothetical protein [Bacteroidales bacterium]
MITFNSASKNVILEKEELVRLTGGIVLSLYSIIISIYYIVNKEKAFKSRFLVLVSTISILYIFLSATRGWMIASALLLLYFLFTFIITKKKNIALIFSSLILLVITYFLIPSPIRRNLELSLNRLATLESLAEGNLTAEGTLIRLSERVPKIMSKIQESPIIGFGYSKISAEYYDGHIANHSIILMGGIVGLLLIWGTLFSIFIYLFQIKVYKSHRFRSLAIGLISILVIHSTSRNMISYYMSADASFLICLIFNLVNSSLTRSLK